MRKHAFCIPICKNKGADQLGCKPKLISAFISSPEPSPEPRLIGELIVYSYSGVS